MLAPPPEIIDANTAISYLISAGGNSKLAAVRAAKDIDPSITEPLLLSTIARDPASLQNLTQQVRLLSILQAIDAFRLTHASYLEKLSALTPKDTSIAYTRMLQNMATLGQGAPIAPTPDAYQTILTTLPPEVAEAVEYFIKASQNAPNTAASDDPNNLNRREPTPISQATPRVTRDDINNNDISA